jgi:PAS domain S-box-containing protein
MPTATGLWRTDASAPLRRYGVAVIAVTAAVGLSVASQLVTYDPRPVVAYLGAILLTGWYAGAGPAALATVLAIGSCHCLRAAEGGLDDLWSFDLRDVWSIGFAVAAARFGAVRRRTTELLEAARAGLEGAVASRTEQLRRSEAYLLDAQRLSLTGCWAFQVAHDDMYWSTECFRILGLDPATTTPRHDLIEQLIHPDDLNRRNQIRDAAMREHRDFVIDYRIVRPDGTLRYIHSVGHPSFDEAGTVVEYFGVLMDVTDRKRSERALRMARARAMRARFAAKLDERNRLAREMHDTLLQGFTGVALELVAVTNRVGGPPETVSALRDVIMRAQRTLEDARRAIWDMRAPMSAASPTEALRAAAEETLRPTEMALEFHTAGEPWPVEPDVQVVLHHVAQEAVTNAARHSGASVVTLTLSYRRRHLRLSVSDDGQGFVVDPELRAFGGHWGLITMRERAMQIGASLTVRSTPGEGATVTLVVPRTRTPHPNPHPTSTADELV